MKSLKVSFFFLCIFLLNSHAQSNLLYDGIQQAKNSGETFEPFTAFMPVSKSMSQSERFQEHFIQSQEVHIFQYDKSSAKNLKTSMLLLIPLGGKNLQLELQEYRMDYQVTTSSGQKILPDKNIRHYHGIVKDDPQSIVAITFGEYEVMGLVATCEGNFNLALDRQSGDHIFYNDNNLKQKPEFICSTQTDDYINAYSAEILLETTRATVIHKPVRLYFETTYDIYQKFGASVETFVTGLYNKVALLYQNEGINTELSEIHIWKTQDPFTSFISISDLLTQYMNYRTSFNGDLGQLLTLRNLKNATGLAPVDVLCNSNASLRLSVANVDGNVDEVPIFSWPVYTMTHEFGHMFGSLHTHDCVWNGNNTAIDGCGTTIGCPDPGMPNGGTIMSYCWNYLQSSLMFSLGFGLQPGNLIRNKVANAWCFSVINGPNSICLNGSYSLSTGQSAKWVVSSGFSVSPATGTSTTVTASAPHQYNGLLTAEINGVIFSKNITTCNTSINGPNTICKTGSYSLSTGQSTTWSVSSGFSVSPTTGTSTTVTATNTNGQNGTLSATLSGGTFTKSIAACGISGPSIICNSGSYGLNTGQSAAWSVSSGFSVSPTTGTSTTVTATNSNGQSGTLTAVANGVTVTKSIAACNSGPHITGPDVVCPSSPEVYTLVGATAVQWGVGSPFTIVSSSSTSATVKTTANQGQTAAVVAILSGNAGAVTKLIQACSKGGSISSYIIAYPNPVDDILTIEIDTDAAQSFLSVQGNLNFDVRLYDGQGNLLHQQKSKGETVQFNVSNLPYGLYYLHVYDGVNSTPEMLPIIIEH